MIRSNAGRSGHDSIGLVDLCELSFDNSFVRELPGDPVLHNVPRAGAKRLLHARRSDTGAQRRDCSAWSDAVGEMLGVVAPDRPTGPVAEVLGGNRVLPGMQPYAARYGGHQFGHWAGQLGDGRAITLGEVVGPDGGAPGAAAQGGGTRHRIRAPPTAARCCAPRCASSCAARPCTTSACRPRAR